MDQLVRLCLCAEVEAIVGSLTRDLSNAVQPDLRFTPMDLSIAVQPDRRFTQRDLSITAQPDLRFTPRDLSNEVQPDLRFTPTQQQVGIERWHVRPASTMQGVTTNCIPFSRLLITTIQLGEGLSCYKLMGCCKSVWNLLILIRTSQSDLTTHVCKDIILHGSEKIMFKNKRFYISSAPLMG